MGSPPPLCYLSTRGSPKRYSFKEAVLAGWAGPSGRQPTPPPCVGLLANREPPSQMHGADDGGMLLPERIPKLGSDTLRSWRGPYVLAHACVSTATW